MNLLYLGQALPQKDQYLDLLKDIDLALIDDSDLNTSIQDLLNRPGDLDRPLSYTENYQPLLFLEEATPEEAFALQDRLTDAGLQPPMLAGKTENNVNWPLKALIDEISSEDLYMAIYNEIIDRLQKADRFRMNSDKAYGDAFMQAAIAIQQQAELDDLKHALAALIDLENAG